MKLELLIKDIKPISILGDVTTEITGINIDSRQIEAGHLFIAVRGTQTDGHAYIGKAIEQGAKAILCEKIPEQLLRKSHLIPLPLRTHHKPPLSSPAFDFQPLIQQLLALPFHIPPESLPLPVR